MLIAEIPVVKVWKIAKNRDPEMCKIVKRAVQRLGVQTLDLHETCLIQSLRL